MVHDVLLSFCFCLRTSDGNGIAGMGRIGRIELLMMIYSSQMESRGRHEHEQAEEQGRQQKEGSESSRHAT